MRLGLCIHADTVVTNCNFYYFVVCQYRCGDNNGTGVILDCITGVEQQSDKRLFYFLIVAVYNR